MLSVPLLQDAIWQGHGVKLTWPMIRRIVDMLEFADRIKVQKIGRVRLVKPEDLPLIVGELQRRGKLPLTPPVSNKVES